MMKTPLSTLIVVIIGAIIYFAMHVDWWLMVAIFSIITISVLILLDSFLFKGDVYTSHIQPTIVSGIMQLLPWVAYPFVVTDFSSGPIMIIAIISGIISMIGFNLYFRAMDQDQDAVVITIMFNLMIALVPLIAYAAIGERLEIFQYIGIAGIFIGAIFASYYKVKTQPKVIWLMLGAVTMFSVSSVMMKYVFMSLSETGNSSVYWSGLLPHTVGFGIVGLLFLGKEVSKMSSRRSFMTLILQYWPIFLFMEGVQVVADMLDSLASTAGNVSIITAMDGLGGIFSASISIGLVYIFTRAKVRSELLHIAIAIQTEQFEQFEYKLIGMFLVTLGAYMIT